MQIFAENIFPHRCLGVLKAHQSDSTHKAHGKMMSQIHPFPDQQS
jgi:hypothetical protein